jgi:hypothetical protein
VKLFHREPREVYRVYDAEEFLERADLELDAEGQSRSGLVGMAGGLLVLLGAVSALTGLFASHRRLPVRGATAQTFRGSRALRAAIALGMGDARVRASHSISRRQISPGADVPGAIGNSVRRSRPEPVKRTVLWHAGSRPPVTRTRPWQGAVSGPAVGHLLVAATSAASGQPRGEFGFER